MKRTFLYAAVMGLSLFISLISLTPLKIANLVNDVLNQTNEFRKSNGLPSLMIRQELNEIAQKHSEDMASGRVPFGHSGFEQRNSIANKEIEGLHSFAENVAFGASSAQEVVTLWKNSPGHRRNMLGHYQYTGIGIAKDSQGRLYYTEIFAG